MLPVRSTEGWKPQDPTPDNDSRRARFWKDGDRDVASRIIRRFASERLPAGGWPWTPAFNLDLCALRHLADGDISDREMLDVLKYVPSQSLDAIGACEFFLAQRVADRKREEGTQSMEFLLQVPLAMPIDPQTEPMLAFQFLGATILLISAAVGADEAASFVRTNLKLPEAHIVPQIEGTRLVFKSRSLRPVTAWRRVEPSWDAFKGVLEFLGGAFSMTISFGGPPRARFVIPPPQFCNASRPTGESEKVSFHYATAESAARSREFLLSTKLIGQIRQWEEVLRHTPEKGSTASMLADAFRLYSQAVEQPFDYACLMHLWQIAELLTQSESSGGKTDVVIRRMARLAALRGSEVDGIPAALEHVADLRNDVVHRGIHWRVTQDDINMFKTCCDDLVIWTAIRHKELPTVEHVRVFFDMLSQDLKLFDLRLRALDMIEKTKKDAAEGSSGSEK